MVCWWTSGRVCSPLNSNSRIQHSSLLEPTTGKQCASWGGAERLERAGEEEGPIAHPTDFLNARFLMKILPFSLISVRLYKHYSPRCLNNSVQYSDIILVNSFLPTCMSLTVWTMDFFCFVLFYSISIFSIPWQLCSKLERTIHKSPYNNIIWN